MAEEKNRGVCGGSDLNRMFKTRFSIPTRLITIMMQVTKVRWGW
jgi:hypothetical protein